MNKKYLDTTGLSLLWDKITKGTLRIRATQTDDAAINLTGNNVNGANVGVYNDVVDGTMHMNMDVNGNKELVVYDSNSRRSVLIAQDANGNYSGVVFDAIDTKIDTAGTGLSKSGTTLNHSNSITAGTAGTSSATSGSTLAVPYVTYDAQGHITATGTHTHTVTGFVDTSSLPISIANGGTGQTTRLGALKALTDENVGTNATYFLTITKNWGKGGYTSVADVKTVLGLGSAAYKNSTTTLSASQTGLIQSNTVFNNLMYKPGDTIHVTGMVLTGYLTNAGKTMKFYFPVSKPISSTVSSAVLNCDNIEIRGISGYIDSSGSAITGDTLIINASRNGFIWQDVATTAHKIKGSTTNYPNNTPLTLVLYDDGSVNATIKLT